MKKIFLITLSIVMLSTNLNAEDMHHEYGNHELHKEHSNHNMNHEHDNHEMHHNNNMHGHYKHATSI